MAGVGCAGKPSERKDGHPGAEIGSTARGGVHYNTDHPPDVWCACLHGTSHRFPI